ncbi:MAG: aminopeptidase [Microgenomates group bacterium]
MSNFHRTVMQQYVPPDELLEKYARILVQFALNSGKGVKKGEVVQCIVPDVAKPLAFHLQNVILESGAHPLIKLLPTGFDRMFYSLASDSQLSFYPEAFLRERANLIDHTIGIIGDVDPSELSATDPAKIMLARNSKKPYRDLLTDKESNGKYTWTIALWGTEAKAKIVGLSLEDYWKQIIQACFLDSQNPIAEWKSLFSLQNKIKQSLNKISIEKVHMVGEDVDLHIQLGVNRIWNGGSGRNIPSFELFTSPDWRGTEGWIQFNQPVYRYGSVIEGARLEFKKGLVTNATATQGEKLLKEMLKTQNADKLGEFSLTDARMSRITHPMAETLFDENVGGPFGNTHVAIGMSYRDCFRGDPAKVSKKEWEKMGFNDSAEHTDIVSTSDRVVTATLTDGSTRVIYKDGTFQI